MKPEQKSTAGAVEFHHRVVCVVCETPFEKITIYANVPKYCSKRCSRIAQHRTRGNRASQARNRVQGHPCHYCGGKSSTVDHVVPKSRGGAYARWNTVASCGKCNQAKADRIVCECEFCTQAWIEFFKSSRG